MNIFISYPDTVPLVEDLSINFAVSEENLFHPVEIATDGPPPTLYELTELPATTAVYQSTNGMTVGDAITSVPTSIHDALIFINTGDDDDGLVESFKYKAIDNDGHESDEATVTFTFAFDFDYPRYFRCIINIATGSSTVIDFANSQCVTPVGDSDGLYFFLSDEERIFFLDSHFLLLDQLTLILILFEFPHKKEKCINGKIVEKLFVFTVCLFSLSLSLSLILLFFLFVFLSFVFSLSGRA